MDNHHFYKCNKRVIITLEIDFQNKKDSN